VVGGLARGPGAWVALLENRELAPREHQLSIYHTHPLHQPEAVLAEQARLTQSGPVPRRPSLEAMRRAVGTPVFSNQIAAGNMKYGIAVQVALGVPESAERNALGVTQEPGGLVVERSHTLVETPDAKQNTETTALWT
jgi:hypothetical protein